MWSVIQSPQVAEAEEVSIDAGANMRPVFIKTEAGVETAEVRPISPGSVRLASIGAWDPGAGAKSPSLYAPPDMNSIVSGQYPLEEGPLSQMSEAVASLDRADLAPGGPCTPHTPGLPATPNTPGTGHKSPRSTGHSSDRKDFANDIKTDFNLDDLNFDPAAIIGENNGDWNLHNMDPNDLLSFLDGPGELATPPSSGAGSEGGRAGGAASQEDLLSLFD